MPTLIVGRTVGLDKLGIDRSDLVDHHVEFIVTSFYKGKLLVILTSTVGPHVIVELSTTS